VHQLYVSKVALLLGMIAVAMLQTHPVDAGGSGPAEQCIAGPCHMACLQTPHTLQHTLQHTLVTADRQLPAAAAFHAFEYDHLVQQRYYSAASIKV
jgi:hypothetical protein